MQGKTMVYIRREEAGQQGQAPDGHKKTGKLFSFRESPTSSSTRGTRLRMAFAGVTTTRWEKATLS